MRLIKSLLPIPTMIVMSVVTSVLVFSAVFGAVFPRPSINHVSANTGRHTNATTGYGGCHEADGDGEVDNGHHGKAHVRFDDDRCEDNDQEQAESTDPDPNTFLSTAIASTSFDTLARVVTIAGSGTDNGAPVTFTLVAVNGPAGVGSYSLVLSDGYSIGGTLLSGAIEVR
jgi:hypothetical protein